LFSRLELYAPLTNSQAVLRRTGAVVLIAAVALGAFFLAPIVPYSDSVSTGTDSPAIPAPSMRCAVPYNVMNPTLVYKGWASPSYYLAHVGIVIYTMCYMPQ
jgi:hypothetical protein